MAGGRKRTQVSTEKVTATLPASEHAELVELIESTGRWVDRSDFVRQAIREKVERWKRDHPLGAPSRRDGGR